MTPLVSANARIVCDQSGSGSALGAGLRGAGGAVGMASVAKGPADGYTILMALSSISVFPVADRINGKAPSYQFSDFAPIALVTADPTVLVVRADSKYSTLKDFVAAAKASPGKINYSSAGIYSTLHVAMEIFADAAGIKLFHVPYQGGGPAVMSCCSASLLPSRRARASTKGYEACAFRFSLTSCPVPT